MPAWSGFMPALRPMAWMTCNGSMPPRSASEAPFDESRVGRFVESIRLYYPGLRVEVRETGYIGIRPKLAPAGSAVQDFLIQGYNAHGVPGLVNLYGIESPGLTASLAIADRVAEVPEAG